MISFQKRDCCKFIATVPFLLLLLLLWLADQSCEQRQHDRRADPCSGCGQGAGEDADGAVFVHRLAHAARHQVTESRERHRRARAGDLGQRLIQADRREDHPRHHKARQDPRRGQRGAVDQRLSDKTQRPSYQKSPYKLHILRPFSHERY